MRPMKIAAVGWAVATFLTLPALAAEEVLTLEPEGSDVTFFLEATGHDVHGSLYLQSGEIRFDPETGEASGEVRIDALRAETGNRKRDKTMHRKVLESDEYPLILFRPDRLEGTLAPQGDSELELQGTVTLHGTDHPLTLPTTVSVEGDRLTARSTFVVPYVEWGLHNPSFFMLRVADEVEVSLVAEGGVEPPLGAEQTAAAR